MRAATPVGWALLLFLGGASPVRGQAVKLVEKLAERSVQVEGRQAARKVLQQGAVSLDRRILLRESEEAAQLLTRKSTPASEEALLARLNRLHGVDEGLRAEFRALGPSEKRLAIELGEGAQAVLRRYPREGAALLQTLDTSGLAQARAYGDFVVDGAHWLHGDEVTKALLSARLPPDQAARASRILGLKAPPEFLQPEHLGPLWKSVIRKTGEGAGVFWKTYVQPHKGKWLAGGLLATYLISPEKFHDAAGKLTEYAVRELTGLGVSVATGAARGLTFGPIESLTRHYAEQPVTTAAAILLAVACLLLAVPAVRRLLWHRLLRPASARLDNPADSPAATSPRYKALRE